MHSSYTSKAGLMLVLAILVTDLATSGPSSAQAAPFKTPKRSLYEDLEPLLAIIAPITYGVECGLRQAAGNVKAVVQNVGGALNQAPNGLADVAGYATAGLGQTILKSPAIMNCLSKCQDAERICNKKCSGNRDDCFNDCEDTGESCAKSCLAELSNPKRL